MTINYGGESYWLRYGGVCSWPGEMPPSNIARKFSLWWRDLLVLGEGMRLGNRWFYEVSKLKLGDGTKLNFWTDKWVGMEPLSVLFPSVWECCGREDRLVAEMGVWQGSGWAWNLHRIGSAVETDAAEFSALSDLLRDIQLQKDIPDRWIWLPIRFEASR